MKAFFIIKDFLLTRNGLIFTASVAILLSILWLNHTRDSDKPSVATSNPEPKSALWRNNSNNTLQDVEKNKSFEPFIPSKAQPPEAVELIPERIPFTDQTTLIAEPPELPIVHEPLIKEEREHTPKMTLQPPATLPRYPELEQGARIDCQLVSSPTTDQKASPILARVTRSVFRDGVLLIPAGSSVFGHVEDAKQDTLYPHHDWTILTPTRRRLSISALAYGQTPEKFMARTGLTGQSDESTPKKTVGRQLLGNVVKGIAALGKDTVRTGLGEYVPSTTRNVVINGSSQIIDAVLADDEAPQKVVKPTIYAPAGQEFTLVVSSARREPAPAPKSQPNIDQLLEKMLRKRLQE